MVHAWSLPGHYILVCTSFNKFRHSSEARQAGAIFQFMGIMVKGDLNKQLGTEAVISGTKEVWND